MTKKALLARYPGEWFWMGMSVTVTDAVRRGGEVFLTLSNGRLVSEHALTPLYVDGAA